MNQFICSKCGCSTIKEVTTQVTQYRYFVVDDMGELECVEDDFESTGYTTMNVQIAIRHCPLLT